MDKLMVGIVAALLLAVVAIILVATKPTTVQQAPPGPSTTPETPVQTLKFAIKVANDAGEAISDAKVFLFEKTDDDEVTKWLNSTKYKGQRALEKIDVSKANYTIEVDSGKAISDDEVDTGVEFYVVGRDDDATRDYYTSILTDDEGKVITVSLPTKVPESLVDKPYYVMINNQKAKLIINRVGTVSFTTYSDYLDSSSHYALNWNTDDEVYEFLADIRLGTSGTPDGVWYIDKVVLTRNAGYEETAIQSITVQILKDGQVVYEATEDGIGASGTTIDVGKEAENGPIKVEGAGYSVKVIVDTGGTESLTAGNNEFNLKLVDVLGNEQAIDIYAK